MADFPASIYTQRDLANVTGQTYDPTKKTRIFAEDFLNLAAEVIAIQTILGINPQGAYDTVKDWLTALVGGGATLTKVTAVEAVDGSRVAFTFNNLPVFCFKDGQGLDDGNGYAVTGSGPWTLTFDEAPTGQLTGFANL